MKSMLAPLATVAIFATGVFGQFMINTPSNAVVCQPLQLTWTGGTASILPGNQPTAPALEDLGQQNGNSFTWTVNIAAGTSIGLNLRDSTGQIAQSAPFTINPGSDTSCVGKPPSTSGGPPATGSTTGPVTPSSTPGSTTGGAPTTTPTTPPAPSTPATTPPATNTNSSPTAPTPRPSTTGSGTTSAGSTSSSSSSNAVPTQAAQFGAAGMIGAAVIALLA